MENMRKKSYFKLFAISLVIFLLAGIVATVVKTSGGDVLVRDVEITPRGTTLHGTMYIPKDALEMDEEGNYTSKRPAVLVSHGYLNSEKNVDSIAVELSRRGFVVLAMDMLGHGESEQTTGKEEPMGVVLGAMDFYDYLESIPYVDSTRIGLAGHSMGGMNTGNAVAVESGFYTLEDQLLNMLYEELGAEVTAEDVAAQDPDAVAEKLNEHDKGVYETRKAEITEAWNVRPKAELFIGSGPGFATLSDAHAIEVAGHTVWRDLQANVGVVLGLYEENPHLMFTSTIDGIIDASRITETTVAKRLFGVVGEGESVDANVWYSLNLSSDENQVASTELMSLDEVDCDNAELLAAIENGTARIITQPSEEHVQNVFSVATTSFAVEFFTTVMQYNNGELSEGAEAIDSSDFTWVVKEIGNGVMLVTLFLILYAVAVLLLRTPFFGTLKCEPPAPTCSKKNISFWVCAALFVIIPASTYVTFFKFGGAPTTFAGNTGIFAWSWFLSQEISTRVGIWAFLNGIIDLIILFVKYLIVDKKTGVSFKESLGISVKGFGKSFLLALLVIATGFILVSAGAFFFAGNDPRVWTLAFAKPTNAKLIAWACYTLIFFVFYYANSIAINSSRMKDMSERANLALNAVINFLGTGALLIPTFVYLFSNGHLKWLETGADNFLAVAIMIPFPIMMAIAAIFARKLYLKTGSHWPSALVNAMVFTWLFVGTTSMHYTMFLG